MAESEPKPDSPPVAAAANYLKANKVARETMQELQGMIENSSDDHERMERLQQKASDINQVLDFVEREFKGVESDDWRPTLTALSAFAEPRSPQQELRRQFSDQGARRDLGSAARPADLLRPVRDREARDDAAMPTRPEDLAAGVAGVAGVAGAASAAASRYRPSGPPSVPTPVQSPQPPAVPRAPSPPPAVQTGRNTAFRSNAPETRSPPPSSAPRAEHSRLPPVSTSIPDDNYEVPDNIKFEHGPNFSDCIASMVLSDTIYDLEDAREDLTKTKDKLRKAQETKDEPKVIKYQKRIAKIENEIKGLDVEHWRKEVEPLRKAYRFEVLRCLQQLDAAIAYTKSLEEEPNPALKTQQEQGQMNALTAKALHDMDLLRDWLQLCLNRPNTWRKDDRLLVGLVKGHPGRDLKDPDFMNDLLQEAAEQNPTSRKSGPREKRSKSAAKDSEPEPAMTTAKVTPDLLEGLLNGAMPKEVAENIQQCSTCKGEGGDIDHAKICSECDGAGSIKERSDDFIELCPKCEGRGFRMSRKYFCPACDGFKIVMRVPQDTQRKPPDVKPDTAPKRRNSMKQSSSTKRAAFDEPEPEVYSDSGRHRKKDPGYSSDAGGDRSWSKRDRNREASPDLDSSSRSPPPTSDRRRRKSEAKPSPAEGLTALLSAASGPGKWSGDKGRRVLEAAMAAGAGAGLVGGGGGGSRSDEDDDEDSVDEKPRRKRRGSTRH